MAPKDYHEEATPVRFINPFTDFGFKKIFGEEPNKDLLIDFVNQILLEQNVQIKDLTYKKTEHLGETGLDRKVVFDLYCENEHGEKFIVEMQKDKQQYFKDRSLYYATFPIQEQGIKSTYWSYELKSVFAIAVLDFKFNKEDQNEKVITTVKLTDQESHKEFYKKLTFIYVQMPFFNKTIEELETRLDKWLYVLKNMEKFDRIPEQIKDKIFEKVFKIAEYHQLSKADRTAYEDSLKYYRDLKNSLDTAEAEGAKKAEELLLPLLEQAKIREEEAKMREEEAKKQVVELVKMLKSLDVPIEQIIEKTGLTKEEIEKL